MAKSRRRFIFSPRTLIIALIVLGGLGYSLYRVIPREPSNIFVVTEPTGYGELTATGVLYKDAPAGEPGSYYLYTDNGRAFLLDSTDLDNLLGRTVTATGQVGPSQDPAKLPLMTVYSLEYN